MSGIYANWRTYKCWCGRTYRSPGKDATNAPLFIECDYHEQFGTRKREKREATAEQDDAATKQIAEVHAHKA